MFSVVATNPPFQDRNNKGKTQHKLWIEFTKKALSSWVKPGGVLAQVSPSSFLSPSSKVLGLFKELNLRYLNLTVDAYFPGVGSSFASYIVENSKYDGRKTSIVGSDGNIRVCVGPKTTYLPSDFCAKSVSIHKKVMWSGLDPFEVGYDYNLS
jgi:hypothetical protein